MISLLLVLIPVSSSTKLKRYTGLRSTNVYHTRTPTSRFIGSLISREGQVNANQIKLWGPLLPFGFPQQHIGRKENGCDYFPPSAICKLGHSDSRKMIQKEETKKQGRKKSKNLTIDSAYNTAIPDTLWESVMSTSLLFWPYTHYTTDCMTVLGSVCTPWATDLGKKKMKGLYGEHRRLQSILPQFRSFIAAYHRVPSWLCRSFPPDPSLRGFAKYPAPLASPSHSIKHSEKRLER